MYYLFSLRREEDGFDLLTTRGKDAVIAKLTLPELRRVLVEGSLKASYDLLTTTRPNAVSANTP
jgi:hypothetical protein